MPGMVTTGVQICRPVTAITADRRTMCASDNRKELAVSTILTYNPVLIDDRNDQPFLKAFVAILAVLTVALLIAVA